MEEEQGGGCVGRVVQTFPELSAQLHPKVRSRDDNSQAVERCGAQRVDDRMRGGVNRPEQIEPVEAGRLREQQHHRVQARDTESRVARPVVQRKDVDLSMWPGAKGAVADRNEKTE